MDSKISNVILIVLAVIGAVAVVTVIGMWLMHATMMGGGGMMGGAGMMGSGMMWLWPVGLLVLVALVAFLLLRLRPRL